MKILGKIKEAVTTVVVGAVYGTKIVTAMDHTEKIHRITKETVKSHSKNVTLDEIAKLVIKKVYDKYRIRVPDSGYSLLKKVIYMTLEGKKPGEIKTQLMAEFLGLGKKISYKILRYLVRKYLAKGLI